MSFYTIGSVIVLNQETEAGRYNDLLKAIQVVSNGAKIQAED